MDDAGRAIVNPDVILDREFRSNVLFWSAIAVDDLVDPPAEQIVVELQSVKLRMADRHDVDNEAACVGQLDEVHPKLFRRSEGAIEVERDPERHLRCSNFLRVSSTVP